MCPYGRLSEALERLQSTQIKTNIEAGGEGEEGFFVAVRSKTPLFQDQERRKAAESGQGAVVRLAVPRDPARSPRPRLCRGLFPIGADRAAHLRGRALDLQRGRADLDLATFRLQIGYQNPLSNFNAALKQIVATDGIPDFHLELVEEAEAETEAPAVPRRGRREPQSRVIITPRPARLEDASGDRARFGGSRAESAEASMGEPAR